ncbi:MAG: hypothetical protein JWO67_151 [Streptosporangiaceae bacterium]|nr:hypothetical protein [Streptosporangiaceae bacterium]
MTLRETRCGNAMGYVLRRWLADALPDDLSSGERLVALEIADQANDNSRLAYGRDLLEIVAKRTGFANPKQVGKVLTKLGARGLELRVAVGKDKNGRPVFAYEGHQVTYRIPQPGECDLPEVPQAGEHSAQEVPQAGPSGPPAGAERSPARVQEVPPAGDPSPQISSITPQRSLSQRPSTSEAMLAALDVEERERDGLIQKIEELNNVKTFGWWINAWNNDTLAERLTESRAAMASGAGKDSAAPPPSSRNNGWAGPHLNNDDPHAFDGYKPHARVNVNAHQPYRDDPNADYHAPL